MIAPCAVALLGLLGTSSIRELQETQDRGAAVADLLAARCTRCHSPGSDTPKATRHWADARDLAGTVQNEDLIVAGEPDRSNLYLAVSFEDMPPPDSGVAPLSDNEKALIADWIREGARLPATPEAEPVSAGLEAEPAIAGAEAHGRGWMQHPLVRWVSHFHPMIVHFPVALLVSSLIAEVLARRSNSSGLRAAASFCLALGALSAVPSAALGWLLAEHTSHHGRELFLHRWLGTATVVVSLVTLWLGRGRPGLRLALLLVVAGLVSATGHLGATMSYGADWLQWPR